MRDQMMKERLEAIKMVGDVDGDEKRSVLLSQLQGDFDPEEFDRQMEGVFNDNWYDADEQEELSVTAATPSQKISEVKVLLIGVVGF